MRKMPIIIQGSSKVKKMYTMSEGSEVMDSNYLLELAAILDSATPGQPYIKIDAEAAKDIAEKLREIASKMTTVH